MPHNRTNELFRFFPAQILREREKNNTIAQGIWGRGCHRCGKKEKKEAVRLSKIKLSLLPTFAKCWPMPSYQAACQIPKGQVNKQLM